MESLLLDRTFSTQISRLHLSLPRSSSSAKTCFRFRRIKCSGQNSSSENERALYITSSSAASSLSRTSKNNNNTVRAVQELMTDYYAVTTNSSVLVEEPVAKEASGRDHGIGIAQYLQGKNYFITGATGFLAKVFIEKMLRSAPTVGKIYLLIKAEDEAAATERLQREIIDSELFICLKDLCGETYQDFMLNKLIPVAGNVCEANLGMNADLAAEIANDVDVIVNSAANTCFDERYDVALNTNTKGPYRLLSFAKLCKKLQLFMHVSTAYVNGEREGVLLEKPFMMGDSIAVERATSDVERLSSPVLDIEAEINLASSVAAGSNENDSMLMSQKMKDLGIQRAKAYGWQNTYVFTKAMGEMILNSTRGDVPVVIMRPTVIESIAKEPLPGWIQGNRMLDPLILSYGKGQLPGFSLDPQEIIDVVPADMVVNATLAAMAKHGKEAEPGLNIYHISSALVNPLLLDDVFNYSHEHFTQSAVHDMRGKKIDIERMKYFSSAEKFSSYIQDMTRRDLNGSLDAAVPNNHKLSERLETKCKRRVDHFYHLAKIYEPYMFYRGWFDSSNTENLIQEMSIEEQGKFWFNVRNLNWKDYFLNVHIPGLRKHVLKK
ncbi:unnamed protein product [Rhodiola kirilowii]